MRHRILWMIDSLMPGGAEQLLLTILKNFEHESFDIRVLALQIRRGNPIADELERSGIAVDLAPSQIRNLRNPIKLLRLFFYVKNLSPELIHTQLEHSDILGNVFAKILRIPSVSTLHTLEVAKDLRFAHFRLKLKWFILKYFCDTIITVSEKTRDHHLKFGNLPKNKTSTIYNGIQLSRFQTHNRTQNEEIKINLGLSPNSIVITTVAVLREQKGIQFMIQALPEILRYEPNLTYLIVGDGVYASQLNNLVDDLGLQERVLFTGYRTDIPDILAVSDLFVLPSLGDALPTVLIEALAAGKPIIATQVGGIPEIITDGINGLLVPPADPESLAFACLKILRDRDFSQCIGTKGVETAKDRFDIKIQVKKLVTLYNDLINQYDKN
jgi:glycosyltransferase involved in cell wall biosynthesis